MESFCTIFNVIPPVNGKKCRELVNTVMEPLQESNIRLSPDEVVFMGLLDHYIDTFTKAKSMIMHSRFTVQYRNPMAQNYCDLKDFEILPIEANHGKNQTEV